MSERDAAGGAAGPMIPAATRVVVSLRAGFVLALANVVCVAILAWAYLQTRTADQVINVTGSAKKTILSDLIVWEAIVSARDKDAVAAYESLKRASDRTVAYLKEHGVPESAISLAAISTQRNFARDAKGNPTDELTSYDLTRVVRVSSADVRGVGAIASQASELLKEGILLESQPPQYLYTKLADLKVEMLAEATKDASMRARQIADNSGSSLGGIREARMGVMQINPLHSTDVSHSGNNDTSSLEKEITAVVSAKFAVE